MRLLSSAMQRKILQLDSEMEMKRASITLFNCHGLQTTPGPEQLDYIIPDDNQPRLLRSILYNYMM